MITRRVLAILTLTLCSTIAGCSVVNLRPEVESKLVIVNPGMPCQILENRKVKIQELKSGVVCTQDVGGWIAMPESHWKQIKAVLEKEAQP